LPIRLLSVHGRRRRQGHEVLALQPEGHVYIFLFILEILHCIQYIHSITFIQHDHPSPFAEVPLHFLIGVQLSGKNLPTFLTKS
jgi:hypothetical protein